MVERVMLDYSEIRLMRSALGVSGSPPWAPYRNRFVAAPNSNDWKLWEGLAEDGFAVKFESVGGDFVWAVTDAGIEQLGIEDLSGLDARERWNAPRSIPQRRAAQSERPKQEDRT